MLSTEANRDQVYALIRLIYEAAGDARQWPVFLNSLCRAVRAHAAGLVVIDSESGFVSVDESINVDPHFQMLFQRYYGAINPWATPKNTHLWTPGRVWEGRELISDEEMSRTEFYNGFLKPQGVHSGLGSTITRANSAKSYISALRPSSVEPDEGREVLATLMPHLQTAVRLHARIAHLQTTLSAMSDALNYLPGGVLIVDRDARVLVMNRAAETMLAGNDGLKYTSADGLVASEPGETLALRTMITAAIKARDGETTAPVPIAITREGRPSLQVLVAPLPPQISGTRRQPSAILFVSDPNNIPEPNRTLLQSTFGLTETEARVAAALTYGKSVEQIAAEFHVSPDTVRSHLKRTFAKTDTSRQGELIRLLLTTWSTLRLSD